MSADQKKVFLSYRRKLGAWMALSVYHYLKDEGYDVFMDVESLDSGEFPSVILHQIEARPHFLVILVPGSLERTLRDGDWLRQEIEHALSTGRNIVPVMSREFDFDEEEEKLKGKKLPAKIKQLSTHNGISVPTDFFQDAMRRLTSRFLKKQVAAVLTPTPSEELPTLKRMLANAARATAEPKGGVSWLSHETLKAPRLSDWNPTFGCSWNAVDGATGYVLQKSYDAGFASPRALYDGPGTMFFPKALPLPNALKVRKTLDVEKPELEIPWLTQYFRVKAKGGFSFLDSEWSNVVKFDPPPAAILGIQPLTLDAPTLTKTESGCSWTTVLGASKYVLERSNTPFFVKVEELYSGPRTEWERPRPRVASLESLLKLPAVAKYEATFPKATTSAYYRVKAVGASGIESPWSAFVS
jgi:hypothetical protein